MSDPLPSLEAALDAAGARGAFLRSSLRAAALPAVSTPLPPWSVVVGTFNVAGTPPPEGLDLAPWLTPPAGRPAPAPDLVALAFQEAVPLSAGNVVTGASGAAGVAAWLSAADAALDRRGGSFTRVASAQLVGLVLGVWARDASAASSSIRGVQATSVGGGGGGLRLGNKGLVAVRLLAADAPVVFLGAHLPSGDGPGDASRRDACLADCLRRGAFPEVAVGAPDPWRGRTSLGAAVAGAAAAFLAGDLNYRLLAPDATVRKVLRSVNRAGGGGDASAAAASLARLAALDELSPSALAGRGAGAALTCWTEAGPLSAFLPTFKLRVGGGGYVGDGGGGGGSEGGGPAAAAAEGTPPPVPPPPAVPPPPTLPDPADAGATPRTPAWTDRVLFRARAGGWAGREDDRPLCVSPLAGHYWSAPAIALSDHAPVAAGFELTPFALDGALLAAALEAARRAGDAAAMEAVPRCEAAPKALALGAVPFGAPVRGGLVLSNAGRVPADWELAPLPASTFGVEAGGQAPGLLRHPPWLAVHPTAGTLAPGEAAAIEVRARGGCGAACGTREEDGGPVLQGLHAAAGGRPSLDAVLVLRTEGGNDEFVLVSADPEPSLFGRAVRAAPAAALASVVASADPPLAPAALARAASRAVAGAAGGRDPGVDGVRGVLDGGGPQPDMGSTPPADAAAALFALLAAAPSPLLPPAAARWCPDAGPGALASVLQGEMGPEAWGALAALSSVAGSPCPPALAAALAPLLLPPPALAGAGDGVRLSASGSVALTPAGVAGLAAAAAAASADEDRRAAVVAAALAAAAGAGGATGAAGRGAGV